MKNRLVALLVVVLLMAGFCWSQDRTIVTVGASYWNAHYSWQDEDGKDLYEFGTGNLFGPYLSLSHGKWNFGTSMYFGTFPMDNVAELLDVDSQVELKRSDLNFTLGYRIHPNINVFGGVKYLSWSYQMEYSGYDWDNYYLSKSLATYTAKTTISGPMFGAGVAGTVPLGSSGLYLFGSVAYLVGTMKSESELDGQSTDNDAEDYPTQLVAVNMGLGYRFSSGLGVNVGYRADLYTETYEYEDYYTGKTKEYDNNIGVKGLVATISYTFK